MKKYEKTKNNELKVIEEVSNVFPIQALIGAKKQLTERLTAINAMIEQAKKLGLKFPDKKKE